jgi:cytochrome c peroxidase
MSLRVVALRTAVRPIWNRSIPAAFAAAAGVHFPPRRGRVGTLMMAILVVTALPVAGEEAAGERAVPQAVRRLRLPATPYRYADVALPEHVRRFANSYDNTPVDNPITDAGAKLGRVLFYDPTLSINGQTSCASCHKQALAFTDDAPLSRGFEGRTVTRNSMSLVNLRYYARGKFFWDERADSLEAQVLMPIENEIEMGHDLDRLEPQLASDPIYPPLFDEAFGDPAIDRERIAKALAQFIRSIVSFDSPYDRGLAVAGSAEFEFANFSEQENEGKRLFFGEARCALCHVANRAQQGPRQQAFFFLDGPLVNGIDIDDIQRLDPKIDPGVGGVTGRPEDFGRFKVSSLRGVEVTGPYMHDGRIRTLETVIEHYGWSLRPHVNLDSRLQNIVGSGLAFPQSEVDALVAFLRTLTDATLLTDPRFSNPFVAVDSPESETAAPVSGP